MLSRSSWQEQKNQIKPFAKNTMNLFLQIAFCAFLGIFTLFFFETTAYQYGHAANLNKVPDQTFFLGAFCIVLGIALINQILQLKKS